MPDDFPLASMGDPAAQRAMTHYAPPPNPAQPYVQALQAFLGGGLQGVANQQGIATPDWSNSVGTILSSPEANAAIGMMNPLKGALSLFGKTATEAPRGIEFLGAKLGWDAKKLNDRTVFFGPPTRSMIQNQTGVSPEIADAVAEYAQWHQHQSIPEAIADLRQMAKDAPHFADIHNSRADILESLLNGDPTAVSQ